MTIGDISRTEKCEQLTQGPKLRSYNFPTPYAPHIDQCYHFIYVTNRDVLAENRKVMET